jgi:hypothetical protein
VSIVFDEFPFTPPKVNPVRDGEHEAPMHCHVVSGGDAEISGQWPG